MKGLDDFSEDTDNERVLHVMQAEYSEEYGSPIISLWCRTEDGERHWVEVEGHQPSFYIRESTYESNPQSVTNHEWVSHVYRGHQSITGDPLVRVYTQLPKHVGGTSDKKGLRDYFDDTWEADVFFVSRFLIDTGIKTHFAFNPDDTWESQHMDGDYRIDVSDIEARDPDWKATPRTVTTDIEVSTDGGGFPEAEDAAHPVTAITAHDNYTDEYTCWVLRYDEWDMTQTEVANEVVENRPDSIELDDRELSVNVDDVRVFDDEGDMLDDYHTYVEQYRPDLLGGWNSSATMKGDAFDYPYLVNRSQRKNVLSFRDWSPIGQVWTTRRGREQDLTMGGKGVGFFDFMECYEKTQWQEPKGGWSLENITDNELPIGDGKLEIDGYSQPYKEDIGSFMEYNIRDVQAVRGIDHAAGVTTLFQNIRQLAGVQFDNCHNNIDLLDVMILRYADEMGLALPTNEEPDRGWYYGAWVGEPTLGRHENVVYPDLWSMYPNMIRNCNMSPETIVGTESDLEASDYSEEDCRWTYIDTRPTSVKNPDDMTGAADPEYEKVYFVKPQIQEGFMTQVVDDLMGMKDHYDGTDLYDAVKRIVNSVYGVYGDSDSYGKGYRLFDWRIAEGITLGGRKMIQDSADRFIDALNDIKDERDIDGENAYFVGGDTDSVMTAVPFMDVDYDKDGDWQPPETALSGTSDGSLPGYYEDILDIVEVSHDAAERVNDWYSEWTAETFNLTDGEHYCELEIESYAPRAFIPEGVTKKKAKKRYAEIIAWEEGDWEHPPEFSATGIDIVRSDRAPVTRDLLEDVIDDILRIADREDARREVYDSINDEITAIEDGEREKEWIARPKGMSSPPESYGSADNLPMPTYKGAKYANEHFDWENLTAGDKPRLLYLDKVLGEWPTTYPDEWSTKESGTAVEAIAVNSPNDVPDDFVVDTEKQIEKVVEDPLSPILSAMGWSIDEALSDTEQANLSECW